MSASEASEDPRQRLLEAAGPVFAAHGFERATVRQICRAANVNIAAVGYYFGDKMGLYLEVIRQVRQRRCQAHPIPAGPREVDPEAQLAQFVGGMLRRMLAADQAGWEAQLMTREMLHPTAALEEMVREYFAPLLDQLEAILGVLLPSHVGPDDRLRLALSVVGQCLYYRVAHEVLQILVPAARRQREFDPRVLARHITAVTIAAARDGAFLAEAGRLPEPPLATRSST